MADAARISTSTSEARHPYSESDTEALVLAPSIPDIRTPIPAYWRVGGSSLNTCLLLLPSVGSQECKYSRAWGPTITIYQQDPYATLCNTYEIHITSFVLLV